MTVLIGADPEFFLKKGESYHSAHGIIPGTKKDPFKVEKGAIQVDGMAVEFNIDPARSAKELVVNINTVMGELRKMIPKDFDFAIEPAAHFSEEHMKTQPEEALELGCDPDFNAYTLRPNPRPSSATTLRTAAGHVHIGFTEGANVNDPGHIQDCASLVRQLDAWLGVPSVLRDRDVTRRTLYGKAGAFRPKPYGVEYRVLSNFWLKSEEAINWVWNQTQACVDRLKSGNPVATSNMHATYIINASNVSWAQRFMKTHGIPE